MEQLKLTAKQLMEKTGFNKSKVYYWINTGKFQTVDSPKGKLVLITLKELEELKELENSEKFETDYIEGEIFQDRSKIVQESSRISELELIRDMFQTMKEVYENESNKTKLLTDSEAITKSQYFELNTKFQTLQIQFDNLQEKFNKTELENSELKAQLGKKSGFFGIKFK